MTDVVVERLGFAPLQLLDLWGDPGGVQQVLGHALPPVGRAEGGVLRTGPTSWLIEGEVSALKAAISGDGAIAAVGGGLLRVRLSGPNWRSLLMEGGLFDFESPAFTTDCVVITVIDHVSVTLRVEGPDSCLAYVPASHAADLLHFWQISAGGLPQ
ncbi:hypothetical protein [Novosphingobium sp. B 225]|uniref:hypothetical protein n=1 Tax=Novosphingobium sp. B 225 TaxID=1961849 RepID=UPI001595966D|nr:hypothetical protein [Novosphingobium sp. B 225]